MIGVYGDINDWVDLEIDQKDITVLQSWWVLTTASISIVIRLRHSRGVECHRESGRVPEKEVMAFLCTVGK